MLASSAESSGFCEPRDFRQPPDLPSSGPQSFDISSSSLPSSPDAPRNIPGISPGSLPIAPYLPQILQTVRENPICIIVAETGAGKSTQVSKALLQEGYQVIVTEPRRLAARALGARVADEIGRPLGEEVGYRTAIDGCTSAKTRLLFCTDGLELVRELVSGSAKRDVLVIDEVHEWNLNMEVLLGWARHRIMAGDDFKLVVMSATVDAESLSRFLGGAPIVDVPGRTFAVVEKKPGHAISADAKKYLSQGKNVQVFLPGKREIAELIDELGRSAVNAELIPLHGELNPEEQSRVFLEYDRPKCCVSTNIGQTSITIKDNDVIIDSGLERRVEVRGGVEGLYLRPVSLADREQRKGRVGRTRPGIYIDHCPEEFANREPYAPAEIERVRLDQAVLRLLEAGLDMEQIQFFHQPPLEQIRKAKATLKALGCIDSNQQVTELGSEIARLPVSVIGGRMLIAAAERGVLGDLIPAVAILETKGIISPQSRAWKNLCRGERDSDLLAQVAVCRRVKEIVAAEKDLPPSALGEFLEKHGVLAMPFLRAVENEEHIRESLGSIGYQLGSSGNRQELLKSIAAGLSHQVYRRRGAGYRGNGDLRELARESVVKKAGCVVGIPWDLEVEGKRGPEVIHLIRMASKIEPAWLAELKRHASS